MNAFRRLRPYLRRYRGQIVAGMVCLIFVDVVQLYFPLFMAKAVDALKVRNVEEVRRVLTWMVALAVTIVFFRYVWRSLLLGASRKIERDLRDDFFAKLLKVPQPFLDHSRSGDLLSLSTNDIAVVRQFLGLGMMSLCDAVVLVTFSVVLMITLSAKLTLLVAIPLPLVTLAMVKLGRRLHDAHETTQNRFGNLSARMQEDIYGVRVLRGMGQEENRRRAFAAEAAEYGKNNITVIRLQGFFYPFLKFLTGIATVLVIWAGGREVIRGGLTLGQFVAFSEYVAMLSWPLMALGWIINLVQRGRASMERLNRVFDETEESFIAEAVPEKSPGSAFRLLEVRNLSQTIFGNAKTNGGDTLFRFENVSLALRRGEWVGLVGKTAAGKSSLAARILRIYEPPAGSIFLDGQDIATLDIRLLRERVAYVPQEGFLFSQSLLSNFKLGARAGSDEDVKNIVDLVQMKEEIDGFPDGLKTRVGERGITLSGGQRQRVALGRALLKDADFYIFDDPFSSVDLATEDRIFEEMRRRLDGRGVLLISHRFRSLAKMDRIVVLDAGRVAEEGTPEELTAKDGIYADLADDQAIEERLAGLDVSVGAGRR